MDALAPAALVDKVLELVHPYTALPYLARRFPPLAHRLISLDTGWAGWASQTQGATFPRFAGQHGLSTAAYRQAVTQALDAFTAQTEVRVRLPYTVLYQVLVHGVVRNQFQTATSSGALNTSGRLLVEQSLMGLPLSTPDRHRPIYGYLKGSDERRALPQYGDVVLRLEPWLRHRTSFVFGDSLDHTIGQRMPMFAPSLVARPKITSLDPRFDILSCAPADATDPRYGYIEAQIHGGLSLSDAREIVFTIGQHPDQAMVDYMQARRIQWRMVHGDDPDGY
jgi:hypothetical protein